MAKNVTFLILYFIVNLGFSQDLKELYDKARNTSDIELAKKVRDLAIETNNKSILADTHYLLAYFYKGQDEFYESVINYVEAVRSYREIGDFASVSLVIENMGNIYRLSGFKQTALNYFMDALHLKKGLKDSLGLITTYYNIGQTYKDSNRLDSASIYYERALLVADELDDNSYTGRIYNDLGTMFRVKGNYEKALEYYDLADQFDQSITMQARTLNNRGNIELLYENKIQAREYFVKALTLDRDKVQGRTLSFVYGNLGKIQADPDSAIGFYESSFAYLREKPLTLMTEYYGTCTELEKLHELTGKTNKADYYDDLQDTFTQELIALQEQLKNLYLRYQVEAATWRIDSEEKTTELVQVNKVQKYVISVLLVAVGGLILLFLYTHKLKKNNDDLKGDNRQLQRTYEKSRRLYDSIIQRATEVHRQINS